ncbi:uromodulin-like [Pocillopora verrucosa]|uniref:uromodulin-like n=1 Tax=Pocillopora verrucosa TaxID=203993 RepID=UPI0033404885
MEFVAANDQCRTEINIQGMALEGHVFKRWSLAAPHLCDVKCGQEITCQSYNYNRKYQICELNNRTKEARPDNFLSAPAWFYIRRLNGRAPLGSIPELPALSCHEIKASEGKHTISGKYWLDPTRKRKAKLIYCDMVNEDMDECKFNISDCDVNANCTNTYGYYKCTCKVGYIGDGRSCSGTDPCYNYRNLSDADRKSTYNTPYGREKCDDDSSSIIFGKWYRFVGDAGTKMPTQCVPDNRCGAVLSGWLKGGHPTLADGEVSSRVCFTRGGDCCKKASKIHVKDCGSYFIYQLQKVPTCDLRYCSTD